MRREDALGYLKVLGVGELVVKVLEDRRELTARRAPVSGEIQRDELALKEDSSYST